MGEWTPDWFVRTFVETNNNMETIIGLGYYTLSKHSTTYTASGKLPKELIDKIYKRPSENNSFDVTHGEFFGENFKRVVGVLSQKV